MARKSSAGSRPRGVVDRIHGSHHILTKNGKALPVPVHGSRDLGAGLLAAIQRQTGVKLK
jgi:predicted RNA binding protein YcfA (HicA-like mRNA interferase family)